MSKLDNTQKATRAALDYFTEAEKRLPKAKRKRKRGGRRPGAGRPRAGTVRIEVRPLARTATKLREMAQQREQTTGQVLDALISDNAITKGQTE